MQDGYIETKGYNFNWSVDKKGYEVVDEALYECHSKPEDESPLYRYSPDHVFFQTHLLARRWRGEVQPDLIAVTPPWLITNRQGQYSGFEGIADHWIYHPKVYEPVRDEPVLHRKFASIDTNRLEKEVPGFANRFGILGRPVSLFPVTPGIPVQGESLFRWREEIEKMGVLLAIWDLVERGQAGKLGQIIIWSSDAVVVKFKWRSLKGRYEILPLDNSDLDGEVWKSDGYGHVEDILAADAWQNTHTIWGEANLAFYRQYSRGDVLGPARYYLCRMLNYHLRGITPSLFPELGYKVAFVPDSLLDALWLMFMLEVNGIVRTCWYCRYPFEPTRKDNVYCSNRCKRMAYYYDKQRKGGAK